LVFVLADNWNFYGGTSQYCEWIGAGTPISAGSGQQTCADFYSNPTLQGFYKSWVAAVVNRTNTLNGIAYKDDPTIMSWELVNEPSPSDPTYESWAHMMSAYVKSLDPHHLVTTGDTGFIDESPCDAGYNSCRFSSTLAMPDVDYATLHMYPAYSQPAATATACEPILEYFLQLGNGAGKPVVLEEFGLASSDPTQAAVYTAWTGDVEDAGGAGWSVWQLAGRSDDTSPPDQYMTGDEFVFYDDGSATPNALSAAAAQIEASQ
jgi:mannan endo-1,4-beta-mannosidase